MTSTITTFVHVELRDADGNVFDVATYPVDTERQIAVARAALRDAGVERAPVYVGEPNDPDSCLVPDGRVVFADAADTESRRG